MATKETVLKEWDTTEVKDLSIDEYFREVIHSMFVHDEDRLSCCAVIGTDSGDLAKIEFEVKIININAVEK